MARFALSLRWTALVAVLAGSAYAHDAGRASGPASAIACGIGLCMMVAIVLYAIGTANVWRHAGIGRGISKRAAICFGAGCLLLSGAIFGPLDALAQQSFATHMLQHELLMVVAAPLLVLGRPLGAWSWTLPMGARRSVGRVLRLPAIARGWRILTAPLAAWSLHAVALWVWHAPVLFRSTAADAVLHAMQHASFLLTALLFWWAVLSRTSTQPGSALLLLFTTMAHTGALGALLVFSRTDLYAPEATASLAAQQLGGLIMWIPAGTVYLLAALAVAHRLLVARQPVSDKPMQASGAM